MNLNSNLKSTDSLLLKSMRDTPETQILTSQHFIQSEAASKEHSRKTSQSSVKSLPLTSTSLSLNSDTRQRKKSRSRLQESLCEIRSVTRFETNIKEFEAQGDEPYELITQPEIPKLVWCAFCTAEHKTYTIYTNNSSTLYNSIAIFLLGGVFGCCLIPYVSKSCKDHKTVCSKCHHLISEVDE